LVAVLEQIMKIDGGNKVKNTNMIVYKSTVYQK
jgi:hypothetical protein